jgi:hypothetical protein
VSGSKLATFLPKNAFNVLLSTLIPSGPFATESPSDP